VKPAIGASWAAHVVDVPLAAVPQRSAVLRRVARLERRHVAPAHGDGVARVPAHRPILRGRSHGRAAVLPMLLLGAWAGVRRSPPQVPVMAIITQMMLAGRRSSRRCSTSPDGQHPDRLRVSLLLGRGQRDRQPRPARASSPNWWGRARSRTRVAEHGRDDGGADLRSGDHRSAGGPLGTGWLFTLNGISFSAIIGVAPRDPDHELFPAPRGPRWHAVRDASPLRPEQPTLYAAFFVFAVVADVRLQLQRRLARSWPTSGGGATSTSAGCWPCSRRQPGGLAAHRRHATR
jgi:hypothetical protein